MASSRFRLDGRTVRPWLTGLVIFAALVWWISWLLDTQRIEGAAEDDDLSPAALSSSTSPSALTAASGDAGSGGAPVPLADLLPLGPEDEGFRVVVRGTVVGEPLTDGFWFLTDEDEVLFARRSIQAESGQDLTLTGTLHQIPAAEGTAWAERARLREAAGWKVHRNLYLEVDPPLGPAEITSRADPTDTARDST